MEGKLIDIQNKANHYCMYIKQLILSYMEEYEDTKIHVRRLTVVLDRLFSKEAEHWLTFFTNDKKSKALQFLEYLVGVGEILHVGEGYYVLPPERTVQFSNNQYVSISNIQKMNTSKFGLGTQVNEASKINLSIDEFLYRPTLEQLIEAYQSNLYTNHDVSPNSIIHFTEKKVYKTESIKNLSENELYILDFNRIIGTKLKPEKYFAKWKNNQWHIAQIQNGDFKRLFLALKKRKGNLDFYNINKLKNDNCQLTVTASLPKEEYALLTLVATPINNINSKSFYFNNNDQIIVEEILQRCSLQNERESKLGIYN